jgi:hypothetical protein
MANGARARALILGHGGRGISVIEMREGERPRVEKRENEIEKKREAADLI